MINRVGRLVDRDCWFVMRLNIQRRYSTRIERSKMRQYLIGKLWTIPDTRKVRRVANRREQIVRDFIVNSPQCELFNTF